MPRLAGSRDSRPVDAFVPADRTRNITESVIREMTRLATQHDAINLAQGFPYFSCPEWLKEAARQAIADDVNQYSVTWGAEELRMAIASKLAASHHLDVSSESEVTVTCGATEAMASAMLACLNPRDEVILFEPFYENDRADVALCGATARYVTLRPPEWSFDPDDSRGLSMARPSDRRQYAAQPNR